MSVCLEEISDGEMRKSQETYILYDTLDVTRLKKGRAAECRNIWLEGSRDRVSRWKLLETERR